MNAQVAQFGFNFVMDLVGSHYQNQAVKTQRIVDGANTAASNMARQDRNTMAAVQDRLGQYNKSINNQRMMKQSGEAMATLAQNFFRASDQATKGTMQQQIAFSEQMGVVAAEAAAAGVGGGAARMVQDTLRLRNDLMQADRQQQLGYAGYDANKAYGELGARMEDSLDYSFSAVGMDYSTDQSPYRPTQNALSRVWQAFGKAGGVEALANLSAPGKATIDSTPTGVQSFRGSSGPMSAPAGSFFFSGPTKII